MTLDRAMTQGLLLVNFHYVRDPGLYAHPGIHPISPDAFRRQMEQLASCLHMATPDEAEAYVLHGKELPRSSALITFDDGLVDHERTAMDILDPMGIKAVFFVCSRPLTEHRALAVHKVHYLRAMTEPSRFRNELLAALPPEWRIRQLTAEERASAARTYIYDRPEHGEIKYLLNSLLPEDVLDQVTSTMLENRGIDERAFCAETYMDGRTLRSLEDRGHCIGAHTHDHRAVTRLGDDEDRHMALNIATLAEATGRPPNWVSYPYGRDWALPADPAEFCKRHGFSVGVTLTGQWVQPEHTPFALDRINTNEVDRVLSDHEFHRR
ncbi:polysaccharide deacetylase family protein [Pseudorhodoplanes sinuspersici]|uniref:polysaccharide deacetylase family protein n=1 Tax=Pseudorhodoplanes sinuspersici TaxID=1235591 RepID=UPI0018DF5E30|nr:polysaccharide deacetylase family protein [Pseudorhodoplanes sinuspersici]